MSHRWQAALGAVAAAVWVARGLVCGWRHTGVVAGRVVSPRFVGRQAELALLRGALSGLGVGGPVAVLVGGEAGIGKSRLVAELTAEAAGGGVRVLSGACVALGAESLPYAPFTQALEELVGVLGRDGVEELVGGADRVELGRLVSQLRAPEDEPRAVRLSRSRGAVFGGAAAA